MKNKKQKKSAKTMPSLLKEIVLDLFVRHWLVNALAVLFVLSAMMLAMTSHQARKLTANWQELREEQQDQQIVWESLRLEITTLTEADRIKNLAKKDLNMVEVTTKNEKVITL